MLYFWQHIAGPLDQLNHSMLTNFAGKHVIDKAEEPLQIQNSDLK